MRNSIELAGQKVYRLGLGTWGLSGDWNSQTYDSSNTKRVILEAVKGGIQIIDTAQVYGRGAIETALGELNLPTNVLISTKIPAKVKPVSNNLLGNEDYYDPDYIYKKTKESIERLGRIDLLQLHNWHSTWNKDAVYFLKPLLNLKNDGLVKSIGISLPDDYDGGVTELIDNQVDFIQLPYNQLQKWPENGIINITKRRGVVLLVRSIFGQGAFLKTNTEIQTLNKDDLRRTRYENKSITLTTPKETITYVSQMVPHGILLIGMRNTRQVKNNIELFKHDEK